MKTPSFNYCDQKKGIYDLKGYESWWPDEVFVLDEEKLNGLTGIDIVVTHTTTSYSNPPIGLGVGGFVNSMIEKFNDKKLYAAICVQEIIDQLENLCKPEYTFFFHGEMGSGTTIEGYELIDYYKSVLTAIQKQ